MHMYTNPPWIYDERIAIILGWITLALALAIFFSCRIFLGFMNRRGWQTISPKPSLSKIQQLSRNLLVGVFHYSVRSFTNGFWPRWHPSNRRFGLANSLDDFVDRLGRIFNSWSDIFLL